ncbi:uncharacterized protein LOC135371619 [Ornithodoros turicata]|uniref:uncharacterized protein LOC135371619 n=1 Tax=Ornithodoros turicata TaxID=34597 RepID=UPI0031398D15
MDCLKQKRAVVRASVTKLITDVDALLRVQSPAAGELQTKLDLLKSKEETLQSLDGSMESLVSEEAFQVEIEVAMSYQEKICTAISQISQKLKKKIQRTTLRPDSPTRAVLIPAMQHQGSTKVKLPKIEVPKFNGDLMNWMTFWDQFESTIHKNETLHNVDKFKYLQSYLTGKAATAISGLPLTNENYDAAIEILNQRFNQRQHIVDQHLNRLLNLPTVADAGDYVHLRDLYDEVQVRVRGLQAPKVEQNEYGVMLLSALRKSVPKQVELDYNRKHQEGTPASKTELNNFLDFLRGEIESPEKSEYPVDARLSESRLKISKDRRPLIRQTTGALTTGDTTQRTECVICKTDNDIESCVSTISIDEKRALLTREGRCFKCAKRCHRSRECRTAARIRCTRCNGHHLTVLCERELENKTSGNTNTTFSGVLSSTTTRKLEASRVRSLILLQTARLWAETNTSRQLVRILLDGGSQRTFIRESLSHDLQCEPVGEENLSICSFGCTPSRRKCRRVRVWLLSQYSREEISVEALEIPEISANLMHDPDSKLITALQEKGLPLADLVMFDVRCSDDIQILVGSDLYWSIVTGESQRIDDNLFAVNTIFGWTLQGPSEMSGNLCATVGVFRLTVDNNENDVSSQLQSFWALEHIGISTNECDEENNGVLEQFNATIKIKDKRYEVGLPWTKKKTTYYGTTFEPTTDHLPMEEYDDAILLYRQNGHAEVAPLEEAAENTLYYMPHRAVIKQDRDTTKVRVVFDASSSASGEPSLNDVVHVGPNLNPEILHLLIKFRSEAVALVADIEKAFLQISLPERDRDALRFLWYVTTPKIGQPLPAIEVLRMTRVPFGAACSPFLLAATIRYHFRRMSDMYPDTCKLLAESFYVDDLATSISTVQEAKRLWKESVDILKTAACDFGNGEQMINCYVECFGTYITATTLSDRLRERYWVLFRTLTQTL